eukprot:m.117184 g.117184  ORF g.117184 m.117184 type:complete len:626 (+) comp37608_c0_seq1:11-1888(+)
MLENVKLFTFFAFVVAILQSLMTNGFYPASISSLERRYDLSSKQSGFLASSYDISCIAVGLFIGYFGGKSHRPRVMAFGGFVLAASGFLWAVPQAFNGEYLPSLNKSVEELCSGSTGDVPASKCESNGQIGSYVVFLLAMIIGGVGGTILWVLAPSFLSDSTSKGDFFVHTGVINAASPAGAALGFLLAGALFLDVYVDINNKPKNLTPNHPAWVGAWWLQFVVSGCLLLLMSFPLLCFPRQIKQRRVISVKESIEMADRKESLGNAERKRSSKGKPPKRSWKDLWCRLKVVLCNPVFMFAAIGNMFFAVISGGISTFLPKFFQQQFQMSSSSASIVAGAVIVPSAVAGSVLVSLLAKKIKLSGRGSTAGLWILSLIVMGSVLALLMVCRTGPIPGSMNSSYNESGSVKDNLTSPCNRRCSCESEVFDPVCGIDGFTYFSPCYAGCQFKINATGEEGSDKSVFSNCSCVSGSAWLQPGAQMYQVTSGHCSLEGGCNWLVPFSILLAVSIFLMFGGGSLYINVIVRSVIKSDRPLAMGVHQIFSHSGYIVGPVLVGSVIDLSCVLWSSSCGKKGSCWVYDNEKMGYYLLAVCESAVVLAFLFFFISWWFFKEDVEVANEESENPSY